MRVMHVAAELGATADPCAHAVPDIGPTTTVHGTSLCGFPADKLTLVPGLSWDAVGVDSRCRFCQEDCVRDQA